MGVEGAAIATVLARLVELSIIVIYVHCNSDRFPHLMNEFIWSF
ncbi:MAG: hypothetical protein ACOX3J_09200 [Clostridia bacterium]